jgi:16S rRNA (adenine1518-N6/adenine1519-N6)-dimethyltransferase
VRSGDRVLEVGPGTGTLTEALLELGAHVVACELDPEMVAILTERVMPVAKERLRVVQGDCLDGKHSLSPDLVGALHDTFAGASFRLVANLPYQAATPLMILLLTTRPDCIGQFVTIQAEVADRIVAKPGSRDYGPLAVYASLLTSAEIIGTLPPSCFWPEPEVTSALVALERRSDAPAFDPDGLGAFLHTLFSKRRKQIGTTLGREGAWPKGVEPTMRPEELSPQQLLALMLARASR